jgi:hypothetical protein
MVFIGRLFKAPFIGGTAGGYFTGPAAMGAVEYPALRKRLS